MTMFGEDLFSNTTNIEEIYEGRKNVQTMTLNVLVQNQIDIYQYDLDQVLFGVEIKMKKK